MPIEFPPPISATILNDVKALFKLNNRIQVAPNIAGIGRPFSKSLLDPGLPPSLKTTNLRNLGKMYTDVARSSVVNPAHALFTEDTPSGRVFNRQNMYLTNAVTRDTNSAELGLVRVMVFRTEDNTFVDETLSAANGVWSIVMNRSGPFFLVAYKVGSPDVAGTSVNTLLPTVG